MASQSLLAVPAKSTKSVDFQEKFLRFIEQNYDEKPSSFSDAIKELNGLREACVVKSPDRHETGLDLIVRCVLIVSCYLATLVDVAFFPRVKQVLRSTVRHREQAAD